MFDIEENVVKMCNNPNPHILIWGQSGQGKTYFNCRKIEEAIKLGKQVLIIDYSGSYTKNEFKKNNFIDLNMIDYYYPYEHKFVWSPPYESEELLIADLGDTLANIMSVKSFFQRQWLVRSLKKHIGTRHNFNIPEFIKTLQIMYGEMKGQEVEKEALVHIERLMDRFLGYETVQNFYVKKRTEKRENRNPVSVIQLTDFPEHEKRFLTELFISSLWKETVRGYERADILVLDELQFLSMKSGGAFLSMLREGRKYGIELMIGTQFIDSFRKDIIESLLQAGNILIFRPTAQDMRFSANVIDDQNVKKWREILGNLRVGEAVLKGNYTLNGGTRIMTRPLICRI